jgi:hypothetical protein
MPPLERVNHLSLSPCDSVEQQLPKKQVIGSAAAALPQQPFKSTVSTVSSTSSNVPLFFSHRGISYTNPLIHLQQTRKSTQEPNGFLPDWAFDLFSNLCVSGGCGISEGDKKQSVSSNSDIWRANQRLSTTRVTAVARPVPVGRRQGMPPVRPARPSAFRPRPPKRAAAVARKPNVTVYPIAKYAAKLNNQKLVERRRKSLRKQNTFQPVRCE